MVPTQIGKYVVKGPLGHGAMGEVYLAEDPYIGREVAIKVLKTSDAADRERFLHEARIVGAFSHPNIVVLHDSGFQDEQPYLVMEYLAGSNLEQWLKGEHALADHLRIMEGLCVALGYAHENGVLHRDLKPSNIQVMPDGQCKLVDFGIARAPQAQLTAAGAILGTPGYMPPEILLDALYSVRADIYSAGLVLYEMLAGTNPFAARTVPATIHSVMNVRPPQLSAVRPDLPRELTDAIMACLARDPRKRPENLTQLIEVIRRLRTTTLGSAEQPGAAAPLGTTRWLNLRTTSGFRRRRRLRLVAAGAAGLFALGAGAWLLIREPPRGFLPARSPTASSGALPGATPPATTTPSALLFAPSPGNPLAARKDSKPAPRPSSAAQSRTAAAPPSPSPWPPVLAPAATPAVGPASSTVTGSPSPGLERTDSAAAEEPAELAAVTPRTAHRKTTFVLEVRGKGLRADHRPKVLRRRQDAEGIRVLRYQLVDEVRMLVTVLVDEDVPLGTYSVALVDADGHLTNSLSLEVIF